MKKPTFPKLKSFNSITELSNEQQKKVDNDDWYRAGGNCVCYICKQLYRDHTVFEINEYFHLNQLCNGDLVKL